MSASGSATELMKRKIPLMSKLHSHDLLTITCKKIAPDKRGESRGNRKQRSFS
jgi:hypothetical protein